jgi:adenylate cyclase
VLFVDLVGSTAMAQRLPPQEVVAMLNEVFGCVVRCTTAEGGWVNKFEGDAALCVFGPPSNEPGHETAALRAARSLHEALEALRSGHPDLDAGIGVSTGRVVAGNVGSEDRYEYTVIGDPVNEAARLTEQAKVVAERVLASRSTVLAADPDEEARWRRHGAFALRGRAAPTEAYVPV